MFLNTLHTYKRHNGGGSCRRHVGGAEENTGCDTEAPGEHSTEAHARFEQPDEIGVQRLVECAAALEIFHV